MQNQHLHRTLEASVAAHSSGGASYDGKIAGLYDLEETLGSGHFAVVKLARHVFTGAKVAVKVVDKTKLDEVSKAHLFQEVRCMKLVQHPNVVRLYEVIDTQTKLYLVLELGDGGDLYDYIMKHEGGLSENLARKYFRQILRAITYCHQLHVVHRDLKPENVVFFEKLGVVKLTDFGFSNKFSPGQKLDTSCGSLAYSAPEILLGDSYDAPAVDIWSLGVILYMLVCGQPPFEKANDSETLTMIMDCKYTVPPQISTGCRKLIASMLVRDPKNRATLEQIAKDSWVKENAESDNMDFLPLISREELSEEDHAFIVQKMINGNIASKEDILQALDKDKYNHITATYFLLAEMRLRKRREEQHLKHNPPFAMTKKNNINFGGMGRLPDTAKPLDASSNKQLVVPISIVCATDPQKPEQKNDKRTRKCSIVREEDEEESSHELSYDGNELKVAVCRRESISDGRLNRSVQEKCTKMMIGSTIPNTSQNECGGGGGDGVVVVGSDIEVDPQSNMVVSVDAALAQKLKQMDKEAEATTTPFSHLATSNKHHLEMQDTIRGLKELEIGKLKHLPGNPHKNPVLTHHRRHTKLNKIRTPSSSSEASDDDSKSRSKKKMHKLVGGDTPVRFRMHRRDSHDDSSDSQDQGQHGHGSGGTGHVLISNTNVSNKKEGQNQTKSESDTHNKSSHSHVSHDASGSSHHKHRNNKQSGEKHNSLIDKQQLALIQNNIRRRRIRESQSLDRITEAQEYEMRQHAYHRLSYSENQSYTYKQRNSLFNLHTFPETKEEEYDDNDTIGTGEHNADFVNQADQLRNSLNTLKVNSSSGNSTCPNSNNSSLKSSHTHSSASSIYKLNSIEEIDLILKDKSLTRTLQNTSSKYFVTIRKIRKLGSSIFS